MENNYAKDSAIAAERETTEMMLAEGQIAFMFGGNWDWSVINAYDYTENMGIMARVPQNTIPRHQREACWRRFQIVVHRHF